MEEEIIQAEAEETTVDQPIDEQDGLNEAERMAIEGKSDEEIRDALQGKEEKEEESEEVAEAEEEPVDQRSSSQKRIDELTARSKTAEEKLDLLRRDPEKYYQQYPDDRPQQVPARPAGKPDPMNMFVTGVEGYEGRTLEELGRDEPFLAMQILQRYNDEQRQIEEQASRDKMHAEEAARKELGEFYDSIVAEMFPGEEIGEAQSEKVNAEINKTLEWMEKTGRGGYRVQEAYFIMTRDERERKAKVAGAQGVVKQLTKGAPPSVNTNKSSGVPSGYSGFIDKSPDEISTWLDNASEKEFAEFLAKAPKELRDKLPGMPWQ